MDPQQAVQARSIGQERLTSTHEDGVVRHPVLLQRDVSLSARPPSPMFVPGRATPKWEHIHTMHIEEYTNLPS